MKEMDDFMKVLLSDKVKKSDDTLEHIQKRLLHIMGPLGKLWNLINSIKDNSNPDQVIDIYVLMKHADQAVLLLGQTINSVSYNRRFAALGDIMKDSRDVKRCLKDK